MEFGCLRHPGASTIGWQPNHESPCRRNRKTGTYHIDKKNVKRGRERSEQRRKYWLNANCCNALWEHVCTYMYLNAVWDIWGSSHLIWSHLMFQGNKMSDLPSKLHHWYILRSSKLIHPQISLLWKSCMYIYRYLSSMSSEEITFTCISRYI